uniref:Uncharacterized protein n=1 Tax=Arundo donax TaxID=35708 RepID=A0A0A9ARR3_ARUDO
MAQWLACYKCQGSSFGPNCFSKSDIPDQMTQDSLVHIDSQFS